MALFGGSLFGSGLHIVAKARDVNDSSVDIDAAVGSRRVNPLINDSSGHEGALIGSAVYNPPINDITHTLDFCGSFTMGVITDITHCIDTCGGAAKRSVPVVDVTHYIDVANATILKSGQVNDSTHMVDACSSLLVFPTISDNLTPAQYVDFFGPNLTANDQAIYPDVRIYITDPNDVIHKVLEGSYTITTNAGHHWSAHLNGLLDPTAFDPQAHWTMTCITRKGVWTSPPLVVIPIEREQGLGVTVSDIQGTDLTSWRLATESLASQTFFYQPGYVILNWIGNIAGGVPIIYLGDPFFYNIEEYTIHGGTLMSHLSQLCKDFGLNFRIGQAGEIIVFPVSFNFNVYRPYLSMKYKDTFNNGALLNFIRFVKSSKANSQFVFTARTPGIQHASGFNLEATSLKAWGVNVSGSFVYAAFYDAQTPPQLVKFFNSSKFTSGLGIFTTPTSIEPAVSAVWSVEAPQGVNQNDPTFVKMYVTGRPPGPEGRYEAAFEMDFPSVIPVYTFTNQYSPPAKYQIDSNPFLIVQPLVFYNVFPPFRYAVRTVESSLWQSNGIVTLLFSRFWEIETKGYHTWSRDLAEIDPFWDVGETILADQYGPESRVETSSWHVPMSGPCSHNLTGYIPLPPPAGTPILISRG